MFRTLLIALLIATSAHAGSLFTATHNGIWRGVGIQTDGSNWGMEVTLGPTLGVVRYPSLRCGGRWRYGNETASSLSGVEAIDYGLENCIETGQIYLQSYQNDQIIFMWCGEEDGVSALAVLTRSSAPITTNDAQRAASQAALDGLGYALDTITCHGKQWLGV